MKDHHFFGSTHGAFFFKASSKLGKMSGFLFPFYSAWSNKNIVINSFQAWVSERIRDWHAEAVWMGGVR